MRYVALAIGAGSWSSEAAAWQQPPVMRLGFRPEQWGDATDAFNVVQGGGSLRTWAQRDPSAGERQIFLGSEGRPIDAEVEIWKGPDSVWVKWIELISLPRKWWYRAVVGLAGNVLTNASVARGVRLERKNDEMQYAE